VLSERRPHLEAIHVRRFRGLLHRHSELNEIQEKLQEILILGVTALHRERQEW